MATRAETRRAPAAEQSQNDSPAAGGSAQSSDSSQASEGKGGSFDYAKAAIATAEKKGGGKAVEVDYDKTRVWKIDVFKGSKKTEIKINDDGSKVESTGKSEAVKSAKQNDYDSVKITMDQALENAIHQQAGTIDEADISTDGGQLNYSVEIYPQDADKSVNVHVDPRSGDILKGIKDD